MHQSKEIFRSNSRNSSSLLLSASFNPKHHICSIIFSRKLTKFCTSLVVVGRKLLQSVFAIFSKICLKRAQSKWLSCTELFEMRKCHTLVLSLTFISGQCCISYRNQLFHLQCKSNEWFLYEMQYCAEMG